MDRTRRARSNSMPASLTPMSATVTTAANAPAHMPPHMTVTEHQVRGFTQATPTQHPTVYLTDPNTQAPSGRVTQEHPKPDNVGAHPPHTQELFFGNVPSPTLQAMDLAYPRRGRTTRNVRAINQELTHPSPPNQPRQLVEVFGDGHGSISGSHRSRAEFHDLTGPGAQTERQRMIQGLRRGPVSTDATRNLSIQHSGARDDWNV